MTERFVLNGGNEHQVYKLGGKVKTDILMQFSNISVGSGLEI